MDWHLIACAFLITSIGISVLYSLSATTGDYLLFKKQILFLMAGISASFFISFLDFRIFKNYGGAVLFLYALGIASLLTVLIFGKTIRGSTGWLVIGNFGFEMVEFVKVTVIILLAKYFSVRHAESYSVSHLIISGVYVLIPVILVLLQPDLGSALTIIMIWLGMIIFSGIKLRHFLILIIIGVIIFSGGWFIFFEDYQKERIMSFFNPNLDPKGASYNILQSMAAISTGGFWGKGFMNGTQGRLGFLPEAKTDFIFSTFVEEFGFAGALLLFSLMVILLFRILKIGRRSSNNFARLFCSGFVIFMLVHIIINIGMNLNTLPIIGISLPLFSYGGSNLMAMFISIGFVQSIWTHTDHKTFDGKEFLMMGGEL